MKRALFFLLDDDTNASSYHRVLQYLPLLRASGIQPHVVRPTARWVYARAMEGEGAGARRGTRQRALFYSLFLAGRLATVLQSSRYDVAVIQRDLFPFGPPVLERALRRLNRRIVYDTDDATYLRPSFTPDTVFQRFRRFDKVVEVVRTARWVSVATPPIAAWARQYNPCVSVVPMALDVETYARARQSVEQSGSLVLGWAGTGGGLPYLEALAPALRRVAQRYPVRVRVVTGAWRQVCLPGIPVDVVPWRADTALAEMAQFDVGLVPLANSAFEQAKFPFKMLQYLALGIPCVCSRLGEPARVLTAGQTGVLADSPEEWESALAGLVERAERRAAIGRAGQELARSAYARERVGSLLAEGLRRAAV